MVEINQDDTFVKNIISAHKSSSYNKKTLQESELCGCFFCFSIFSPKEIKSWWDNDNTAECPICGIDTVIGSATNYPITPKFLKAMNTYWF